MKNLGLVRTRPLREQVVTTLREAILTNELKGGEHLILSELAATLGCSVTPVREAIRTLEHEGLVVNVPRRECRVANIDSKFIRELYVTRMALECEAVRRACGAEDKESLERSVIQLQKIINEGRFDDYYEENREYHRTIWALAGNGRMERLLDPLLVSKNLTRDSVIREYALQTHEDHVRIAEAIMAGEEEAAAADMRAHLEQSMVSVLKNFDF